MPDYRVPIHEYLRLYPHRDAARPQGVHARRNSHSNRHNRAFNGHYHPNAGHGKRVAGSRPRKDRHGDNRRKPRSLCRKIRRLSPPQRKRRRKESRWQSLQMPCRKNDSAPRRRAGRDVGSRHKPQALCGRLKTPHLRPCGPALAGRRPRKKRRLFRRPVERALSLFLRHNRICNKRRQHKLAFAGVSFDFEGRGPENQGGRQHVHNGNHARRRNVQNARGKPRQHRLRARRTNIFKPPPPFTKKETI